MEQNDLSAIITHSYIAIPVDLVNRYANDLHTFVIPGISLNRGKFHTKDVPLYKRVVMDIRKDGNKKVYILFPRFCGQKLFDAKMLITPKFGVRAMPILGEHITFPPIDAAFSLYPLQTSMINEAMSHHLSISRRDVGKASCLLQMETGGGKSFLAIGIIIELVRRHGRVRVLWLVLNRALQEQAIKDIKSAYSDHRLRICTSIKNISEFENAHICVIIINSALKLINSQFRTFGLIIYDEIPNYVSEARRDIFWNAKASYTIGMTAEISARIDKLDEIYLSHLGDVIYGDEVEDRLIDSGDINERIKFDVNYKLKPYHTPDEYKEPEWNKDKDTRLFLPTIKKCIVDDTARNIELLDGIIRLRLCGHAILALVHHREHVLILTKMLHDRMKLHENIQIRKSTAYRMMSGDGIGKNIAENALGADLATFSQNDGQGQPMIYIATYGYASVGISFNHLTALVLGAPPYRVKKRQIVGRIIRMNKSEPEKNKIPRVIWALKDSMFYMQSHWNDAIRYFESREFKTIP